MQSTDEQMEQKKKHERMRDKIVRYTDKNRHLDREIEGKTDVG